MSDVTLGAGDSGRATGVRLLLLLMLLFWLLLKFLFAPLAPPFRLQLDGERLLVGRLKWFADDGAATAAPTTGPATDDVMVVVDEVGSSWP